MRAAYELVDAQARKETDLRAFEEGIRRAVYDLCGSNVKVTVNEKDYELDTESDEELSSAQVRQIGKKISLYCPELRNLRKTYYSEGCDGGKTTQIFRKKVYNEEK